jgi:phosphatidylethanolamine-binding protein (PEBP) family uncharacterized protein
MCAPVGTEGDESAAPARRTRPPRVRAFAALAAGSLAILAACGSSGGSTSAKSTGATGTTGSRLAGVPLAPGQGQGGPNGAHGPTIGVATGARAPNGVVREIHTCYGRNISPQLSWKGLPGALANAKEIVVLVHTLARGKVETNWAVAGIKPSVDYIPPGRLPPGAIVGKNSYGEVGYRLCPPNHEGLITMGIDALPEVVPLKSGFDPSTLNKALESPEVAWGSAVMFGSTKRGKTK